MAQDWVIHGVPMAIERDGWWMDDDPPKTAHAESRAMRPLAVLLMLVLLADILFWGHRLGLSLALFALAAFAASLATAPQPAPPRPAALIVLLLSLLPVIDFVQALSLAILTIGTLAAITMARTPSPLLPVTFALIRAIPLRGLRDLWLALNNLRPGISPAQRAKSLVRTWALP